MGNNEGGAKKKRKVEAHRPKENDNRVGGQRPKLSRKQQIEQLACDSICETDDETAEGGRIKENSAASEG